MERKYVRETEVSEITGIPVQTLRNHRSRNQGLPFIKYGRTVLYDVQEVYQYLDSRKVLTENARAVVENADPKTKGSVKWEQKNWC